MRNKIILLCFTLILVSVFAISCTKNSNENIKEIDGLKVELDNENKTACIVKYSGKDEEVVIPENIDGYTVISIGIGAFSRNYDLNKVILPNTVEVISTSAFNLCVSLKDINLPSSLQEIENTAFSNCRVLETITIPENVNKLGVCVFTGCLSLKEINVAQNNGSYSVDDSNRALMNKEQTKLIQYATGNTRKSFEIPNTVTEIDRYAFENSKALENVTFPQSLKLIGSYAFHNSAITEAVLPDNLENIGDFCFYESKLITVTFGNGIKKIGNTAFGWCTSLTDVVIPASVETIGQSAFYMCTSVKRYTVNHKNTVYSSDNRGVLFNKDKTTLLYYPLGYIAEEYTIPNGVTEIKDSAFFSALNLKKLVIPDSVETIGSKAFSQCANLKEFVYEGTMPKKIATDAFE